MVRTDDVSSRLATSDAESVLQGGATDFDTKLVGLIVRLDGNLEDYHDMLMKYGKREIIDMASKAAAMSDTHMYLTGHHDFDDDELDFLLQLQNPLEVVAEEWQNRQADISDISGALEHVIDNGDDILLDHALTTDAPARTDLRRFMDVDLYDFLGGISEQVIIHYPNDWNIDRKTLERMALSDDPDDKRLMWHVCSYGTHIYSERETFIRDTGAFNCWVDYRPNEPDMFGYYVEVTGFDGNTVTGNVFEVGHYAAHAMYVRENSTALDSVTLTYDDSWGVNAGKTITVPRFEYNDDRQRLMSDSGDVVKIQYHHAASVRDMPKFMYHERALRMAYPIGDTQAHLKALAKTLAEIRDTPPPEQAPQKSKQTLDDMLGSAGHKVKAQDAQNNNKSRTNREERG